MSIIEALSHRENFSINEQTVADYILIKKEKILEMSVQQISKETYTSTSAIVRLCRKIGLNGFKDFKIKFAAELQRNANEIFNIDSNFPFEKNDSLLDISSKMLKLTKDASRETYEMILNSRKEIENAISLILKSKQVALFGIGDSYIRALDFQNRLMKINRNVLLTPIHGEQGQLAISLHRNDCAIIISYSGQTKMTYQMALYLKRKGVPIISITSNPKSKIAKLSQIILTIPNKESINIKITPIYSQLCIEYYLSVLYSYLFVLEYDENLKNRIDIETIMVDTRF